MHEVEGVVRCMKLRVWSGWICKGVFGCMELRVWSG